MRRLESYIRKYGPEAGPELFRTLQSQAAHASVSARLRRKVAALSVPPAPSATAEPDLPLFPGPGPAADAVHAGEVAAPRGPVAG